MRWHGEFAENLAYCESLAAKFGESSPEVARHIAHQRAVAKGLINPNSHPLIGMHAVEPLQTTPASKLDAEAKRLMRESRGQLKYDEALGQAIAAQPHLYAEHRANWLPR